MCHKRQSCDFVFSLHTAGTLTGYQTPSAIHCLNLNASTHIEPLQDNKVSTGESLTSFFFLFFFTLTPYTTTVHSKHYKLPSTLQEFIFFFFVHIEHKHKYFLDFFFPQTYTRHGKKKKK